MAIMKPLSKANKLYMYTPSVRHYSTDNSHSVPGTNLDFFVIWMFRLLLVGDLDSAR